MPDDESKVILSDDFFKKFISAGVVPSNCRRMVLDMTCGDVVHLYYECFGDERLLEIGGLEDLHSATKIASRHAPKTRLREGPPATDSEGRQLMQRTAARTWNSTNDMPQPASQGEGPTG